MSQEITLSDFQKVDIRVWTVVSCEVNTSISKPSFILFIDFWKNIGIIKSSAQITDLYLPEDLLWKQLMAVVNFPPRQIGKMMSECLVLGFESEDGIVLARPDTQLNNWLKLH